MAKDKLKVNQSIEIDINEGPYQGKYISKISEIRDEQINVMAIYDGELLPLRIGLPLKVYFYGDQAVYSFDTEVIKRIKEPIPLLVLDLPDEFKRIQRRQYYRLKINENVYYRYYKDENEDKDEYKKTYMVNLSGGGALIVLKNKLKKGDKIELLLDIDQLKDKPLAAEVMRIITLSDGYTKAAGVRFINIKRRIQDKIVGWIFDYQLELRRRGML